MRMYLSTHHCNGQRKFSDCFFFFCSVFAFCSLNDVLHSFSPIFMPVISQIEMVEASEGDNLNDKFSKFHLKITHTFSQLIVLLDGIIFVFDVCTKREKLLANEQKTNVFRLMNQVVECKEEKLLRQFIFSSS